MLPRRLPITPPRAPPSLPQPAQSPPTPCYHLVTSPPSARKSRRLAFTRPEHHHYRSPWFRHRRTPPLFSGFFRSSRTACPSPSLLRASASARCLPATTPREDRGPISSFLFLSPGSRGTRAASFRAIAGQAPVAPCWWRSARDGQRHLSLSACHSAAAPSPLHRIEGAPRTVRPLGDA